MKIMYNLLQKSLTLFLCLILFKSTIIFADPEETGKSAYTSSEEMRERKEPLEAKKTQEELTSESGEKADIEEKEKSDVTDEKVSLEEMKELKEIHEARKAQEVLPSEAEESAKERVDIKEKEKSDVAEKVILPEKMEEPERPFGSKEIQEKLTSEAGEKAKEEEKETDVIEDVINKAIVEKKEVSEDVKSAVKKAVVENKELPDEVETAIKSTLVKDDDESKEDAPLSSSAENVVNQLDDISTNRNDAIIKSFISDKRPLLHIWNILTTKLNSKLGLNLGLAYTSLYQYASDAKGTKDAASGDLDIIGAWSLWNKKSNYPSSLGFHAEYRHRYTSNTPEDLSEKVGSLWKTIRGFNRLEFSLVEIWWDQQIQEDILSFRIGKLNMKDYFNNYKFKSSNRYFFNSAFSDSPAIAFPQNGGGLVLAYQPTKKSYMVAGIADADGKKDSLDNTFFFTASKYFYSVELGVKPKFNNLGKGTYSLTLWHREDRDEEDLPSDEGFAISLEQELTDKIIPFVRYSCSDGDSTKIQQLISTGIGFVDTFGREKDVAGIGLAWGTPSDKILRDQYTMDSFYRFQVMNHFHITPGLQLLVNPSNDPGNDFDSIITIRARITF